MLNEEVASIRQEIELISELRQEEENQDTPQYHPPFSMRKSQSFDDKKKTKILHSITLLFQLDFMIYDLNEFVDNLIYGHAFSAQTLHINHI